MVKNLQEGSATPGNWMEKDKHNARVQYIFLHPTNNSYTPVEFFEMTIRIFGNNIMIKIKVRYQIMNRQSVVLNGHQVDSF